jgi:hypothetical protein
MAIAPSTGNTAGSALPAAGGTSESTLSSWAGPYVTNMLGQAQAIAAEPYQVYQGPMTAGESGLQSKVFQGLGNLSFPGQLGQTFSSTGAYQPPAMTPNAYGTTPIGTGETPASGGISGLSTGTSGMAPTTPATAPVAPTGPTGIAAQYMNPYLQAVLGPQMEEMRRQSQMNLQPSLAKLTQAGGYGGSRQAIMESEANRNLLQEQNKTLGQGYASAYDRAMGQFNTEQGQNKDLVNMLANAGQAQRGIEQEGITADYNEFLAQRDDPMKKTQYLQSMLQGLPYQTVTNTPLPKSGMGQLAEITGSLPSVEETLKKLGLI